MTRIGSKGHGDRPVVTANGWPTFGRFRFIVNIFLNCALRCEASFIHKGCMFLVAQTALFRCVKTRGMPNSYMVILVTGVTYIVSMCTLGCRAADWWQLYMLTNTKIGCNTLGDTPAELTSLKWRQQYIKIVVFLLNSGAFCVRISGGKNISVFPCYTSYNHHWVWGML